ncbi:MAG TPA: SDR family oxidoreductase [Spirochaetia bacterium]|nr:SDR family oxidoreductase [Spirochaetia bacterium]
MQTSNAIFITGASSGIGHACAARLTQRGFHVFAGVRKQADADRLKSETRGGLTPVMVDVTDSASISRAVELVRASPFGASLRGLVNNAGVSVAGPLEMLPLDAFRKQIEVNVVGQLAVTQAFIPLLRAAGRPASRGQAGSGRIVIMGSILGRFSLPCLAAYSCAKFALEAMADSLSMELHGRGIAVTIIEPGSIATPIWEKSEASAFEMAGDFSHPRWDPYREMILSFRKYAESLSRGGISPSRVARTVEKALTATRMRKRYTVGWDSRLLGRLVPLMPMSLRQTLLRGVVLRR